MGHIKAKVKDLKPNPNNPRVIRDEKFKQLVQSIIDQPSMFEPRPIVVNPDMVVLGGNMRLRAVQHLGWKEVPTYIASWSEIEQRAFIIKDNVGFGEWDWDMMANDWDEVELKEWGVDVWQPAEDEDISDVFNEVEEQEDDTPNTNAIVLNFTEEEYAQVMAVFENSSQSKEQVVFQALCG